MNIFKFLVLFSTLVLYSSSLQAQDLVVNLLSGESENYPVGDVRSVTFPGNAMVVNLHNGTIVSFDIADVDTYQFDMNTSIENLTSAADRQLLTVYPNPAAERVQIAYTGKESDVLMVEILDSTGQLVESLYNGKHWEETRLTWLPSAVAKGTYLCRVTAQDRVVINKIIVH